ncbi:helix-turn-helix domain-containing protein [Streptomyces sp. AcH 505]|uniref:helix-turn-helix domain-containing protein n=1 Tax=Streptomyces sp. AcH 505 TaxID=352211 RepID=UPI0018E3CC9A
MTGEARVDLRDLLAERYRAGESVRELAERVGRSYGSVHQLLKEAGVKFRSRRRWS